MAVILDDVARVSGVSRATASRALSGDPNVSESTRVRVEAVAHSLGYRVNHAARSLAMGQTNVLGFLLPPGDILDDPFRTMLLSSTTKAANKLGKGVMLWMAGDGAESEGLDRLVKAGMVDGFLVDSGLGSGAWIEGLLDLVPVVAIGSDPALQTAKYRVSADSYAGGALCADHLLDLGHTRIAVISEPMDRDDRRKRLDGFSDRLAARSVELPQSRVADGDWSISSGYRAMRHLLSQDPTAVFVPNDQMAAGAYAALLEAGLHVPNDVSVVGFDDVPAAAWMLPPLTTVRQDVGLIATLAVDLLLTALNDPETEPTDLVIDMELVERQSTQMVGGS